MYLNNLSMTNKLQLFQGTTIRTIWDSEKEEWYFSVVDVCNVLSGSKAKDPGAYWRKLKQRLKAEGSEVVTNCHGLSLKRVAKSLVKEDL